MDPNWGVIGAVGKPAIDDECGQNVVGHWCDPHRYFHYPHLPHRVQSLDEMWLGIRKSRGIGFDPDLPGFHCYGMDLSLSAREKGMQSYAIDNFVWHKYKHSNGSRILRREHSEKITVRTSEAFKVMQKQSADYVARKWKHYLPFHTTSLIFVDIGKYRTARGDYL
jgi:hypothetical protein